MRNINIPQEIKGIPCVYVVSHEGGASNSFNVVLNSHVELTSSGCCSPRTPATLDEDIFLPDDRRVLQRQLSVGQEILESVTVARTQVNKVAFTNFKTLTQRAIVTRPPIFVDLPLKSSVVDDPLVTYIFNILQRAVTTRAFHSWSPSSPAREFLQSLATQSLARDRTFHLDCRSLGSKALLGLLIASLLSGFTMGEGGDKTPFKAGMLGISMIAAAVFNYMGTREFSGISRDTIPSLIAGIISAIAPAVMTLFGVTSLLGASTAVYFLGALAAIANFFLSAAVGAVGVQKVWGTIKDFYYSSDGLWKIEAIVELILFSLLAAYLTMTRSYEVARFFYDPPTGTNTLKTVIHDSKYIFTMVAGIACNIPEWALFLMVFLKLRMKIAHNIRERKFPKSQKEFICMLVALLMGVSFFVVFKTIGKSAWENTLDSWFDKNWRFYCEILMSSKYAQYYTGVAAASLVVGEGGTVMEMWDVLVTALQSAKASCGRSAAPGRADTVPLLASEAQSIAVGVQRKASCFSWPAMPSWLSLPCCGARRRYRPRDLEEAGGGLS